MRNVNIPLGSNKVLEIDREDFHKPFLEQLAAIHMPDTEWLGSEARM